MTKYSKYQRKSPPRKVMNPLWRGVGCLLMLIVPAMAYGIGYAFLQEAKRRALVPPGLLGYIHFPDWVWGKPVLDPLARFFGGLQDVWAMLIFFLATLFILTGLVSLIYSMVYQFVGPPRYTELDAPPSGRKTKEYKR
ncbi:MAG: hypothetical protein HY781_09010 [Chloroflexi bacterium]|nr:hypothetical protein [Chloroflexota bacterium]